MTAGAQPPSLSFEERFAALRRDWRATLPAKIGDIRSLMDGLRVSPQDAGKLEDLHRALHTMAGTAGTFGLDELGNRARAVEHELDRVMELPAREAASFDGAQQLLQELLAHVPQE